jgi:hypothetical protein
VLALKREGVTGEWRKLHNEHSLDLYYLPDFIRVIKSKTIRLAGDVARRGRREMHTGFWLVNLRFFGRPRRIWNNNIKIDLKEKEGRS